MRVVGDLPSGGVGSTPPGREEGPGGRSFPRLETRSLTGAVHTLPEDFGGAISAVLVGFEERHQAEIDSWLPTLEGLTSRVPGLGIYELVLLRRSYLLARPVIDGGMAAGIPSPKVRARTLTCYTNLPRVLAELGLPDARDAALFVLDGRGRVVWWAIGGYNPGLAEDLAGALSAGAAGTPGPRMPDRDRKGGAAS